MIKIMELSIANILNDEKDCSEMITKACSRHSSWQVKGVSQNDSSLFVIVEDGLGDGIKNYRLAPLPHVNQDELVAEIKLRYYCGFSTVGTFMTDNGPYGLFAEVKASTEEE